MSVFEFLSVVVFVKVSLCVGVCVLVFVCEGVRVGVCVLVVVRV